MIEGDNVLGDAADVEALNVRGNIYSLLSRVFIREVDGPFLEILKRQENMDAFSSSGTDYYADFSGKKDDEIIDELAVEFAALFLISPGRGLSPYESVQLSKEGLLFGESATETLSFYREEGFDFLQESNIFPDHFAVQLEFMGHLSKKAAKMLDTNIAETIRERQAEFMNAHLGRWHKNFINTIKISTENSFYSAMSQLAGEFLDSEAELLAVKKTRLSAGKTSVA